MEVTYIAVDKNGDEAVYDSLPYRDEYGFWTNPLDNNAVDMPKGTCLKLTGKELTWEDEPIELI